MDQSTFKKYNILKKDKTIYKYIWTIKNNNERNAYINYLYVCLNKDDPYIIEKYYTDNLVAGMPNVFNIIKAYVYFNHYNYRFDIHLFKNNKLISNQYTLTPTIKYKTKLYHIGSVPRYELYQQCIKYNNQIKQLLYFYIYQLTFPKDITFCIASYLMGEPNKIGPDTKPCTTPSSCCHSRNISI